MSSSSSARPCGPSALHTNTTPTPEPARYRKNDVVDGSAPFIPTMALPFHCDTPQPRPKTPFVPLDVVCAVHILFTVSGLSTLPGATSITKWRRSSADASKPPEGYLLLIS